MKLYRFSPIKDKTELLEAIQHMHFACFELCKQSFGKYLPVAGNIGVFCHYEDEYKFLTELRKEIANESENWNQKYYRLLEPIVIPARGEVPEAIYTYLYIRRPDPYRAQIGDIDFVLGEEKYKELKNSLLKGEKVKGARIFERPELDMVELYDSGIDSLAYIVPDNVFEKDKTN